jgi:hypothetical protein
VSNDPRLGSGLLVRKQPAAGAWQRLSGSHGAMVPNEDSSLLTG